MTDAVHIPVMPAEVMQLLDLKAGETAMDGTLGLAGHSLLMARQLGPQGHLVAIDRDASSLAEAKRRLADLPLRVDLLQGNFGEADRLLAQVHVGAGEVDAILLDLGISSFQLDDPGRGFAFKDEGPLDMRMDTGHGPTAADLVGRLSEAELARIIEEYGEERFARRIAKAIVFRRSSQKIETTGQLSQVILKALPLGYTRGRIHPATRTFQALRIAVNHELEVLPQALGKGLELLKPGGRLCIISFHSLEDRIVKTTFRRWAEEGKAEVLTKKPLTPSEAECAANPRSRSAKVRAIRKI